MMKFAFFTAASLAITTPVNSAAESNECNLRCKHGSCEFGEGEGIDSLLEELGLIREDEESLYEKYGCPECELPSSFTVDLANGTAVNEQYGPTKGLTREMHCKCDPDFMGTFCEIPLRKCGGEGKDPEHVCFHGAECKMNEMYGVEEIPSRYGCDCSKANMSGEARSFAGHMCEHASSVYCAKGLSANESRHSFCVHGDCVRNINPAESHPGCRCDPGWEGLHCEFHEGTAPKQTMPKSNNDENKDGDEEQSVSNNPGSGKGGLVVGVVGVFIGIAFASVVIITTCFDMRNDKDSNKGSIDPVNAIDADGSGTMAGVNDSKFTENESSESNKVDDGEMA